MFLSFDNSKGSEIGASQDIKKTRSIQSEKASLMKPDKRMDFEDDERFGNGSQMNSPISVTFVRFRCPSDVAEGSILQLIGNINVSKEFAACAVKRILDALKQEMEE